MTIEHPVQQGTVEWLRARLGIPTASMFHEIVCPTGGELLKRGGTRKLLSDSWRRYGYKLIAERLLNEPMESLDGIEWVQRGKELEGLAVGHYEFTQRLETRPAGFFTTDNRLIGASPDRVIIGKSGGVEVKCPAAWNWIGFLVDGPGSNYRPQVQGQMMVCEWDFVDLHPYHPAMAANPNADQPSLPIRTYRDDGYITLLRSAMVEFCEKLAEMERRARALGIFQAQREARTPHEIAHAGALREELIDAHGLPP